MKLINRRVCCVVAASTIGTLSFFLSGAAPAQGPPGGRGTGRPPQLPNLPTEPTAVESPALSARITGPGPMFDTAPSQAPGHGPEDYGYVTDEYFVSGTADGKPFTSRLVVRRPADDEDFSGLVLAESMHSSGAAHAFEYTAMYVMDSGHAAVEILTVPPTRFDAFNADRYRDLDIVGGQANDILAQVGALIKSDQGPLAGLDVRKTVLSGSSMSSGTLINYLPAHMVYRTPEMGHIYDGYMPTSTGATIPGVDVPLIQLPTMHEYERNVPRRQDSDEPGQQYRLYEFAAIGHVDSRDNIRLLPNPCAHPLSTFPAQAYMSVGLHHLLRWVDEGIVPPRADRTLLDRNVVNDGSQMLLDEHGNGLGGIRNPYVDVPTAKYVAVNSPASPPIENPNWWLTENANGAATMCRLSAYQLPFPVDELRALYGSPADYRRTVEERLDELEAEGWSLPVYRDLILADARAMEF
ncbi:alpha/beta hydrolase domain-containing protein [Candidatus Rariloculus sp.]|uniref:alpha/beta hydrolase domain-containing protein n=1 Tax=Candidatus Rariloculus sp. TaxID=3101265 RepID=UPI003D09C72A